MHQHLRQDISEVIRFFFAKTFTHLFCPWRLWFRATLGKRWCSMAFAPNLRKLQRLDNKLINHKSKLAISLLWVKVTLYYFLNKAFHQNYCTLYTLITLTTFYLLLENSASIIHRILSGSVSPSTVMSARW